MMNMKNKIKVFLVLMTAAIFMTGSPLMLLAQGSNSVGGGANGASVNVTATVLGVPANVSVPLVAPVTLPPQGGSNINQVASVNIGLPISGVLTVLSTGLIVNSTSGNISSSSAHAESTSTVNGLNVLNGLITATTIHSKSASDGNGASATSSVNFTAGPPPSNHPPTINLPGAQTVQGRPATVAGGCSVRRFIDCRRGRAVDLCNGLLGYKLFGADSIGSESSVFVQQFSIKQSAPRTKDG